MRFFGRRRPGSQDANGEAEAEAEGAPTARDVFAAEVIAGHDDAWILRDATVVLDFDGLEISASVGEPSSVGPQVSVALYLAITGNRMPGSVFASFNGYGDTEQAAVVEGACLWTCSFLPVLRCGYGSGPVTEEVVAEVVTIDGTDFRLYSSSLGRALMQDDGAPQSRIDSTRARLLPDQRATLSGSVADSALLPVLSTTVPTLLSVFVGDSPTGRVVEVKINGSDWPLTMSLFDHVPNQPQGAHVFLRELAVLVPVPSPVPPAPDPPFPGRAEIERRLRDLAAEYPAPAGAMAWPGWDVYRGNLGAPAAPGDLTDLGPVPPGYEALMEVVGAPGAGPGYGMLRPRRVHDVIPLAHAGCGCTWVVRLDADHFGEVWADAAGSDTSYTKVANTAGEWYLRWLENSASSRPWIQWNSAACSSTNLFGQIMQNARKRSPAGGSFDLSESIREGGIAMSGGGAYLEGSQPMDPCQGCVSLAMRLGLAPSVFATGVLSTPGSVPGA